METSEFKVGDKVLFGRPNGEQTQGTVVKVNRKKLKVRQDEDRGTKRGYNVGTVWTVPPSLCRPVGTSVARKVAPKPAPKRPEKAIMGDILDVYGELSPENLCCDGELSLTAVRRKSRSLNGRLARLQRELGRKVSEEAAYRYAGY